MRLKTSMGRAKIEVVAMPRDDGRGTILGQSIRCRNYGCAAKLAMASGASIISLSDMARQARQAGWDFSTKGRHRCPQHKQGGKPMTTAIGEKLIKAGVATPPVQNGAAAPGWQNGSPTPDQRRRIFRAIDECYDEANKRYVAGHSDDRIAADLKFPRAWVADERDRTFGPAGRDPAFASFDAEMSALSNKLAQAVETAINAAQACEKGIAEVKALRERLTVFERQGG